MAATSIKLAGKVSVPWARLMVTRLRPLGVQRLAQHLQCALAELGQLVQEQHAAMGQADLARSRPLPAAHQPGVADGVVRGAEGPQLD
jgi:hypothetical protein